MSDMAERLRTELEKRAFHAGDYPGFEHIEYCDFCHYSREWIAQYGHDGECLLRRTDSAGGSNGNGD